MRYATGAIAALVFYLTAPVALTQSGQQTGTEAPSKKQTARKQTSSTKQKAHRKAESHLKARVKLAELLQQIYKSEGRLIKVQAVGEESRTLELSSGLMVEGSHTLDAARRETIDCADCLAMMRKSGFAKIVLRGPSPRNTWNYRLE